MVGVLQKGSCFEISRLNGRGPRIDSTQIPFLHYEANTTIVVNTIPRDQLSVSVLPFPSSLAGRTGTEFYTIRARF